MVGNGTWLADRLGSRMDGTTVVSVVGIKSVSVSRKNPSRHKSFSPSSPVYFTELFWCRQSDAFPVVVLPLFGKVCVALTEYYPSDDITDCKLSRQPWGVSHGPCKKVNARSKTYWCSWRAGPLACAGNIVELARNKWCKGNLPHSMLGWVLLPLCAGRLSCRRGPFVSSCTFLFQTWIYVHVQLFNFSKIKLNVTHTLCRLPFKLLAN